MSVLKEINYLMKNLDKISSGQAKFIKVENAKNTLDVYIDLHPHGGLYKGGNFLFIIQLFQDFPRSAPAGVACMSPIFHPNIFVQHDFNYCCSNVCLNILDNWHSTIGLTGVVAGLLYLLYNPQIDDPYVINFRVRDMEDFEQKVRAVMRGEEINDWEPTDFQITMDNFKNAEDQVIKNEELMDIQDICDKSQQQTELLKDDDLQNLFTLIQNQNSEQNDIKSEIISQTQNPQLINHITCDNTNITSVPGSVFQQETSYPVIKNEPSECSSPPYTESQNNHNISNMNNSLESGEITPFNVSENFQEQFCGFKFTKHGTTVLEDRAEFQCNEFSNSQPFLSLIKRFTV